MRKLRIPELLKQEFSTVEAVWGSVAETRRVDALILSWVKYEKQLRRLFTFLVYQHPGITRERIEGILDVIVTNRQLYPESFIALIKALKVKPIPELLGDRYDDLWKDIKRIKRYRNKMMHGQLTGESITSWQLERDVIALVTWIGSLASAAQLEYGYDGLKRRTFTSAKVAPVVVERYPFETTAQFKSWLEATIDKMK